MLRIVGSGGDDGSSDDDDVSSTLASKYAGPFFSRAIASTETQYESLTMSGQTKQLIKTTDTAERARLS